MNSVTQHEVFDLVSVLAGGMLMKGQPEVVKHQHLIFKPSSASNTQSGTQSHVHTVKE